MHALAHGLLFEVRNDFPVPAHVRIDFSDLRNLDPEPRRPAGWIAPGDSERLGLLRLRQVGERFAYRYRFRFVTGHPEARPDPRARYRMPFGGSAPRRLAQGALGGFSHRGDYAFDFKMPVGTPVLAAREGVVLRVVDGHDEGGRRKSLKGKANKVVVLHADGTQARYVHLAKGIAVAPGESVAVGQPLGRSGNTGYTTGPHLHFDVVRVTPEGELDTVPIRFESAERSGFLPGAGGYYPPQEPRQAR